MSNRIFKQAKNKKLISFSPVLKKLSGSTFAHEPNSVRRDVSNSVFGHNFINIPVKNTLGKLGERFSSLAITASPEEAKETRTIIHTGPSSEHPHPFTAFFQMAMRRTSSCRIPKGQHGAAKIAKFKIIDAKGNKVTKKLTVQEQFKKIDGPDEVFNKLKPNTYETAKGYFDDCYRLYSKEKPPYFKLKLEQNHIVDREIISKNHIIYTPSNVMICVFPRKGKGFGTRCKFY
ncbi:MAG: hypothetical protein D8M57_18970 [Candidatus Scalindua sp. AMX11]|nr:hypothetical protein [Planctomycetota bacterium]RZV62008.1 MAG: hypothetical protein EX341_18705 [Candidatus Scalindua sp. SCAELEC01]TDE63301.1 MAG: hypothetical protein D8M57_18970 [Candidatus Scalindua sp. AMX11]GJQ57397.1 MAG: hypothetical protein SCALA701_01980 [Candidatus Scalindua sp.]